jgi:hypothetical protein
VSSPTTLRQSFEQARSLPLGKQIQECVDLLQNPEFAVAEVLDAYRQVAEQFADGSSLGAPEADAEPPKPTPTLVEGYFWETRELMVLGDKCSFTCLATNVDPSTPLYGSRSDSELSAGLDYVGLTCDKESVLVLGAVQAPGDATAYPLLLRLLACLTEIAPNGQLERMNREHFKGTADPERPFDLNLVLWDSDRPETTPVSELTRDLAEHIKKGVLATADFPTRLRDIVCLRMNAERFDGRMRFDWRV